MPTDTFSIAAGADDAYVLSTTNANYASVVYSSHNSSATSMTALRSLGSVYNNYLIVLEWDTSALPDGAIIESALLRVRALSKNNANSRSLVGEYFAWTGSGAGDWTLTAPASPILSAAIASISTVATTDIPITDLSGISKTGNTFMRLHISGGQPTGLNTVELASFEHATQPEPQLLVTYSAGEDLVGMVGI